MKYIFILLFLFTTLANAANDIGKVTELKGSGSVKRTTGDKIDLKSNLGILFKDEVSTGQGRTRIDFIDATKVELTEHSKLIIDEFVYDPNTKTGALSLKASLGSVRYASGQIAKNSQQNVKIQTPTATISVRGTDFAMVIDELGGSTIILLPSCDKDGLCYVGEISVDSDAGQVILNQAFQATRVETPESKPFQPITLDLDPTIISNLLILSPPKEINQQAAVEEKRATADILGIDFLQIDALNQDLLAIKDDSNFEELDVDYLAQNFLADVLDQINAVLRASFLSDLTNVFVEKKQKTGQDSTTGIIIIDQGTYWQFSREDTKHIVKLKLSKTSEYVINMSQDDFITQDFIVGDGGGINRIDIIQK